MTQRTGRVLVTGSRDWTDAWTFQAMMAHYLRPLGQWDDLYGMPTGTLTVVHGACPSGLDHIADQWCINSFVAAEPHPADWARHGKAAGPLRNQTMVDLGADVCLAFPLAVSRGTWDCARRAEKSGIPVLVYEGAHP